MKLKKLEDYCFMVTIGDIDYWFYETRGKKKEFKLTHAFIKRENNLVRLDLESTVAEIYER